MTAPMRLLEIEIPAEWVDYNDHLNDAYHALAFSRAGDAFMERLGLGEAGRKASGRTVYTLGLIIRYLAEAKLGERIAVSLQGAAGRGRYADFN
jgi:acyl-CoA thioester hydrolase